MNATTFRQPTSATAEVLERLRSCLPQRRHQIRPETSVSSLGLDSLDLVELLCALDGEFNLSITLEQFESLKTVGELAALIDRKIGSSYALR